VRNELGSLRRNTTVGSFLVTFKPRTSAATSFMAFYLAQIERVASKILPTRSNGHSRWSESDATVGSVHVFVRQIRQTCEVCVMWAPWNQ